MCVRLCVQYIYIYIYIYIYMHCLKREVTGYIVSEQGSIPTRNFRFFAIILRPAVGIVVMVVLYE